MTHSSRTRRDFLVGTAAATAGLVGLPTLLDAASGEKPYGIFTVGVQSYCFRHFDTEGALKRTEDLGLHFMELWQKHAPPDSSPEKVRALLKRCHAYGITPAACGVQSFTKDYDASRRYFDFAHEMGVKVITADPAPESLDGLDRLVGEHRIAIAIHPHGPLPVVGRLHRWYSADVILKAVRDRNPLIGSCLDTGHLIRAAQLGKHLDPAEEIRKMGARNFALHLKDHDNRADTDVVYGRGALDVPAVLRALRDVQFRGPISVEYEANPDNPVPDMRACLGVLRDAVRGLG